MLTSRSRPGQPQADAARQQQHDAVDQQIARGDGQEALVGHDALVVHLHAGGHQLEHGDQRQQRGVLISTAVWPSSGGSVLAARQHHVAQALAVVHAAGLGALDLAARHRLDADADDLAHIGRVVQRHRHDAQRHLAPALGAGYQHGHRVIDQIDLHQQRRGAHELHIAGHRPPAGRAATCAPAPAGCRPARTAPGWRRPRSACWPGRRRTGPRTG